MAFEIDLGDEVLVAREDHDQDEIAGKRQIDERQHGEDGLLGAAAQDIGDRVDDLLDEDDKQHAEREHEADIERRHQPAREKQAVLEHALERPIVYRAQAPSPSVISVRSIVYSAG